MIILAVQHIVQQSNMLNLKKDAHKKLQKL